MSEKKEDHRLFVTILTEKSRIDDVLCKVFLPKRLTDPLDLYFYPNEEQRHQLEDVLEFSMISEHKGFSGGVETKFQSNKTFFTNKSSKYWGYEIKESEFIGNPMDLKIIELIDNKSLQKTIGCFWLTPSAMLSPVKSIEPSYTGNIKVETGRQFKFTLSNGLSLGFDKHFKYAKNQNGDTVTFTELVAEFETEVHRLDDIEKEIIAQLDDFLMLVSFVERHRCICLGWDMTDSESHTTFYRRNFAIPDARKKPSFFEALIDVLDFDEFIELAYNKFIGIEPKGLIRQAIQYAMYREDKTVENSFLTLYSAIETLLLYFRRNQQLETVFASDNDWKHFQKDLMQWLKNSPLLSGNETRRSFIYEKIQELNRISFLTAFKQLCNFYDVDLSDLWPIVKNSDGISLSEIRNKLVHGETFNLLQLRSLMAAREHLQWIVERLILVLFGWSISKSKVNKDYLAHNMACYNEWKEDRKILSQMQN